jgi:hypothetical protein
VIIETQVLPSHKSPMKTVQLDTELKYKVFIHHLMGLSCDLNKYITLHVANLQYTY